MDRVKKFKGEFIFAVQRQMKLHISTLKDLSDKVTLDILPLRMFSLGEAVKWNLEKGLMAEACFMYLKGFRRRLRKCETVQDIELATVKHTAELFREIRNNEMRSASMTDNLVSYYRQQAAIKIYEFIEDLHLWIQEEKDGN